MILPWLWIAAGVLLLYASRQGQWRRPGVVLAGVLVLMGVGDFFLEPRAPLPGWLLAWKVGCAAAALAILLGWRRLSGRRAKPRE